MSVRILIGDCVERMREMPDNSVDSVVCDPPYHLTALPFVPSGGYGGKRTDAQRAARKGFMGQTWDGGDVAFQPETWAEVLRVLKPGGHLVAFSGTRTYHRMAVAIEDAGFEVRDMIAWHYGSGFPKSHDISKAIDKARDDTADFARVSGWLRDRLVAAGITTGALNKRFNHKTAWQAWTTTRLDGAFKPRVPTWEQWCELREWIGFGDEMDAEVWRLNGRKGQPGEAWNDAEVVGIKEGAMSGWAMDGTTKFVDREVKAPNSDAAREWEGWGTALKPATEPICLARKPLSEKSIAANVLKWGTGALNIDGCRIEHQTIEGGTLAQNTHLRKSIRGGAGFTPGLGTGDATREEAPSPLGRWPANLCHDGSDEVVAGFPETESGVMRAGTLRAAQDGPGSVCYGTYGGNATDADTYGDSGSAARFFYCAKATTEERNGGLDTHEIVSIEAEWALGVQKAKLRVDTAQSPPKVIAVSDAQNKDVSAWNTLLFGSESEAQSLSGCKSTTRTAISSTTTFKTLSFLARSITNVSIAAANSETENGGSPAETAASSTRSVTITSAQTVCIPGVGPVQSPTQLRISVSEGVSTHPTVKPIALMRWLVRLVTPKGGTVLDPFMGSGSTLIAADAEQFNAIGCELSPEYAAIAERRIRDAAGMFADVAIADRNPTGGDVKQAPSRSDESGGGEANRQRDAA